MRANAKSGERMLTTSFVYRNSELANLQWEDIEFDGYHYTHKIPRITVHLTKRKGWLRKLNNVQPYERDVRGKQSRLVEWFLPIQDLTVLTLCDG